MPNVVATIIEVDERKVWKVSVQYEAGPEGVITRFGDHLSVALRKLAAAVKGQEDFDRLIPGEEADAAGVRARAYFRNARPVTPDGRGYEW